MACGTCAAGLACHREQRNVTCMVGGLGCSSRLLYLASALRMARSMRVASSAARDSTGARVRRTAARGRLGSSATCLSNRPMLAVEACTTAKRLRLMPTLLPVGFARPCLPWPTGPLTAPSDSLRSAGMPDGTEPRCSDKAAARSCGPGRIRERSVPCTKAAREAG